MSMLKSSDGTPDEPVIDSAAEMLAIKELDTQEFPNVHEKAGFHHGYMLGFKDGADFMRTFYRKREGLRRLEVAQKELDSRLKESVHPDDDDRCIRPVPPSPDPIHMPLDVYEQMHEHI